MNPTFTPDLLARLSGWVTDVFGLRFPPDRWSELARGVASAALELGIADLTGWSECLVRGDGTREHLAAVANHLTISETYFFRHSDHFALLEGEILPARLKAREGERRGLRIWSAGAASGEEPYSVAILIQHRFGHEALQRTHILATDINSRVLARARAAPYSEWSFRDAPEWLKPGYFDRLPGAKYLLRDAVRTRVRFISFNLASSTTPPEFAANSDFDVILCRNVLMYLSGDAQERALRRFVAALATDGWLIVGPCDVTREQAQALRLQIVGPGIFRLARYGSHTDDPGFRLESKTTIESAPIPPVNLEALADTLARLAHVPPEADATPSASPSASEAGARAQALADRGELGAALVACGEAIAADKTNPHFHYLRGCILQEQNRLPEAEQAFQNALYLAPDSVAALFAMGCLADRTGRTRHARHYFQLVLRALRDRKAGEPVPGVAGLTVGRLQSLAHQTIKRDVPNA